MSKTPISLNSSIDTATNFSPLGEKLKEMTPVVN